MNLFNFDQFVESAKLFAVTSDSNLLTEAKIPSLFKNKGKDALQSAYDKGISLIRQKADDIDEDNDNTSVRTNFIKYTKKFLRDNLDDEAWDIVEDRLTGTASKVYPAFVPTLIHLVDSGLMDENALIEWWTNEDTVSEFFDYVEMGVDEVEKYIDSDISSRIDNTSSGATRKKYQDQREVMGMTGFQMRKLKQALIQNIKKARKYSRMSDNTLKTVDDSFNNEDEISDEGSDKTGDINSGILNHLKTAVDDVMSDLTTILADLPDVSDKNDAVSNFYKDDSIKTKNSSYEDDGIVIDDENIKKAAEIINKNGIGYQHIQKDFNDMLNSYTRSNTTPPLDSIFKLFNTAANIYGKHTGAKSQSLMYATMSLSNRLKTIMDEKDVTRDYDESDGYSGFKKEIVEKIFGPEGSQARKLFDRWYNARMNWLRHNAEKRIKELEDKISTMAKTDTEVSKNSFPMRNPIDKKIEDLQVKVAEFQARRKEAQDPDEIGELDGALNRLLNQLEIAQQEKAKSKTPTEDEEDEDDFGMNYMEEQVGRDKFKKNPNQQFVGRGLRKFSNQNEWLMFND